MCFQPFPHGKEGAEPAPFISTHYVQSRDLAVPTFPERCSGEEGVWPEGLAQPFEATLEATAQEAGSLGPSRTGPNRHAVLAGQLSWRQGTQGEGSWPPPTLLQTLAHCVSNVSFH